MNKYFYHRGSGYKVADLLITNRCNLNCSFCNFRKNNTEWIYSDFLAVMGQMKEIGVKTFIITGGGEPTMNPDLPKMLAYLSKNNLEFGINTNGTRIIPGMENAVWLKINLDAWSAESYKQRHGVDLYDKVKNNIRILMAKNHRPKIGVQYVVDSKEALTNLENNNDIPNCDYAVVRPEETPETREKYEVVSGVIFNKLMHKYEINPKFFLDGKKFPCPAIKSFVTVSPNCEVMYCCHRPELFGNARRNLKEALELRDAMKPNEGLCHYPCRLAVYNQFESTEREKDFNFI